MEELEDPRATTEPTLAGTLLSLVWTTILGTFVRLILVYLIQHIVLWFELDIKLTSLQWFGAVSILYVIVMLASDHTSLLDKSAGHKFFLAFSKAVALLLLLGTYWILAHILY